VEMEFHLEIMQVKQLRSKATFDDHGTTILTEYFPTRNNAHCEDGIGGVNDTFLGKREC
jgi:hypothetical protein